MTREVSSTATECVAVIGLGKAKWIEDPVAEKILELIQRERHTGDLPVNLRQSALRETREHRVATRFRATEFAASLLVLISTGSFAPVHVMHNGKRQKKIATHNCFSQSVENQYRA
ncbi:MAG: hypothetical protein H0V43_14190 [Gemmatimonadales bacterium]|nr:hypothetical protein [Gemmatimonadales bacterium]